MMPLLLPFSGNPTSYRLYGAASLPFFRRSDIITGSMVPLLLPFSGDPTS
jgi:hypothetical protein